MEGEREREIHTLSSRIEIQLLEITHLEITIESQFYLI